MKRIGGGAAAVILLAGILACGVNYSRVVNLNSPNTAVVCFGDSITRGYGAEPGREYPTQLSARLGVQVVNAGRDGDTTATALERIDEVLALNPRLVIVELTGNDRLNKVPVEETLANLDRIVTSCQSSGAMVVLVHAKLGLWSDPYWDGFKEIGDKRGVLIVKNFLKGIITNPKLMYDQIHPNGDGYAIIADRVAAVVQPLLAAADAKRK